MVLTVTSPSPSLLSHPGPCLSGVGGRHQAVLPPPPCYLPLPVTTPSLLPHPHCYLTLNVTSPSPLPRIDINEGGGEVFLLCLHHPPGAHEDDIDLFELRSASSLAARPKPADAIIAAAPDTDGWPLFPRCVLQPTIQPDTA